MKKDKFITDFEDIPTPRQKMPHLTIEERKLNFKEVELGFTEEIALRETSRCLSCRRCIGCGLCLAECDQQAIVYDQKEEYTTVEVDSIVIATGTETFDARKKPELGYAYYPNVITNIEFERILNANGPFGGIIMRPSDGEVPQRVAFIQCVGSREEGLGVNYCSNICCITALKQSMTAMNKIEDLEVNIFYTDFRPFSKDSEHYYLKAKDEYGIKFVQAKVDQVIENSENGSLTIKYSNNGKEETADFDLVILSTGITPSTDIKRLSRQVGARLNKYGFFPNSAEVPVASSGEDIWFAGSITHPIDLSNSLAQASAAAAKVLQSLIKKDVQLNGKLEHAIKVKDRNESDRVGIFFCRYGLNSQLNIDPDDVIKSIQKSNGDLFTKELEYGCNTTGKHEISEAIEKEKLGRVIIAPCYSQPNHLKMFQQLIQSAGLPGNRLMIFDADQQNDGWNTEDIEQKLMKLIKSEEKTLPSEESEVVIITEAAVIGNSITALQSALDIAEQDYKVHLLVQGSEVALHDQKIFWHTENIGAIVRKLDEQVSKNSNITVHKESQIKKLKGNYGSYKLVFDENGDEKSITVGAIVIATGSESYQPNEFNYGENKNVVTQSELNKLISEKDFSYRKIVMIQCIGSRQLDRPYCSQICCEQAIKNALKIKQVQPEAEINILHRDIRVYDFEEDNYADAIEKGVNFIRMDKAPAIKTKNGKFDIHVIDRLTNQPVKLEADLIVLSNGIVPHSDNRYIAEILNVSLNSDGFFSNNDNIMKSLHSNQPGIFVAGLAYSPQRLENALMQANAVTGKIGVMFRSGKI
jgi:heterodisulfide reductase subunit A-like polyferredoxin